MRLRMRGWRRLLEPLAARGEVRDGEASEAVRLKALLSRPRRIGATRSVTGGLAGHGLGTLGADQAANPSPPRGPVKSSPGLVGPLLALLNRSLGA